MESSVDKLNAKEKSVSEDRRWHAEHIKKSCKYIRTPVELRIVKACLTAKTAGEIAEETGILGTSVSRLLKQMTARSREPLLTIKRDIYDDRVLEIKATKKASADYMRFKKAVGEA